MTLSVSIIFCCACAVQSVTINSVQIRDNVVPVKGSSIQLVCSITGFTTSTVEWYITDTQDIPRSGPGSTPHAQCIPHNCVVLVKRHIYTADDSHMYVNITELSQNNDGKWWTCRYGDSKQALNLVVNTVPTSIQYERVPDGPQDLSVNAVIIQCITPCVYPEPAFTWFYVTDSALQYQYTPSGVTSSSTNTSCTYQEKDYTSTLTLKRNTTFTNNSDTTVRFRCGITSFPGLLTELYTPVTPNVTFAVKVTSVDLKKGTAMSKSNSIVNITSAIPTTLTCLPGLSRPPSTVVWYIGSQERQRSVNTSFTFTPSDTDHGMMIHCKVFNIQPEINGVQSDKAKLYVKVQVSGVNMSVDKITVTGSCTINVTEYEVKMLECKTGISRPRSTIVWYTGGNKVSEGNRFNFTSRRDYHGLYIYCNAYNIQPESEAISSIKCILYVRVPTTTPTLANKTTSGSVIVLFGDVTRLVCITSATRPAATVTWMKGETSLHHVENTFTITPSNLTIVTSIVTFTPDKSDNNKTIACMTRISGQTDFPSVKHDLNVWWGPSNATIEPSSPFPWRENQTDKYLLCKVSTGDDGNPAVTVNWTSQYGTHETTNRRLVFPVLSSIHDKMAATCDLNNDYTRLKGLQIKSQTTKLDVQYVPLISIKINNTLKHYVTVIEGQSLNITCFAVGNPTSTVQWLGRTTVNGQLQFADIDRDDDNTYICRASSIYQGHVFAKEQNISVVVNYAPDVSIKPSSTDLTEKSSLKLVCIATGRPANYEYTAIKQTWMNMFIPNSHEHLDITTNDTVTSFEITSLQFKDSGNYTCQVNNGITDRNGILNQTATVSIKVKVSPKILSKRLIFAGNVSKTINISIPFYSYPSVDTITFTKLSEDKNQKDNTAPISIKTTLVQTQFYGMNVTLDGNIAICNIAPLNDNDVTWYRLTIKNSIGISSHMVKIIAVGPPGVPESLRIEYIGKTYVVLSWKRGFHGGFNQTFMIQIRTGVTQWHDYMSMSGGQEVTEDRMFATVDTLLADKTYYIRMYSNNLEGNSVFTDVLNCTTLVSTSEENVDKSNVVTGGIIGCLSILCLTLVLTVFILRRRQCTSEDKYWSWKNFDNETNNDAHVYYRPTSVDETVHYDSVTTDRKSENQYKTLNSDIPTENTYIDMNQEQEGQLTNEDRNVYVNLQLNIT